MCPSPGDSWGIFTFLCAALCNLPALPALNCSEELGAGQSIQQTYDLTRYLEHQLRTLAGTYVSPRRAPHPGISTPCPAAPAPQGTEMPHRPPGAGRLPTPSPRPVIPSWVRPSASPSPPASPTQAEVPRPCPDVPSVVPARSVPSGDGGVARAVPAMSGSGRARGGRAKRRESWDEWDVLELGARGTRRLGGHGDMTPGIPFPFQLNYLGPPFNEPDFNPPRLARAERVPSATVDLDLWRGLTDNARLAANYRAYSRLLCYLRVLDGQVGTAELRHRLAHFCASLQGLVLSIGGVMSSLGYPLPAGPAGPPAPPGAPAAPNDFLKKMDDFWLLKELQTWLWRSAKDFNRLKKKVPPAVVTLRLEARGF